MLESAKLVASGIATIGLAGAGVGKMPKNHRMLKKRIKLARKTQETRCDKKIRYSPSKR